MRIKGFFVVIIAVLAMIVVPSAASAAGCGVLRYGATGYCVRTLQQELINDGYSTRVTGNFRDETLAAVKLLQSRHGLPADGVVGARTWQVLLGSSPTPAPSLHGVDSRTIAAAKRQGVAIDANKAQRKLRVVRCNGSTCSVVRAGDARFGRAGAQATRSGVHSIYYRRDGSRCRSNTYNAAMPYCSFFYKGQAIHYSANFAAVGWRHPGSYGCINLRDMGFAEYIYNLPGGTRVVVH